MYFSFAFGSVCERVCLNVVFLAAACVWCTCAYVRVRINYILKTSALAASAVPAAPVGMLSSVPWC